MPFNGSGTFQRVRNWVTDAASGVKIRADYHDSEDDNFAAGITNCIAKDGQTTITQNIPFNGKRITGLGDPTAAQDAVTRNWVDLNVTGGALIADTPPAAGKVGNLWWDSDSGNLFLRFDDGSSVQWVQVNVSNPVADEKLVSVSADMSALFKTGPNRFVLNDKVDGSGTDVATISETGAITAASNAILATTGAGQVYLRPNGASNSAGETYVDANGYMFAVIYSPKNGVNGGFNCKAGDANLTSNNWFNFWWDSGVLKAFVDRTYIGAVTVTSDYRIKKDVTDLPSTWDKVKAMRPISYTQAEFKPTMSDEVAGTGTGTQEPLFLADDIERWGFIAHETQASLVATAASGKKDMEDGIQALNWAPIVAALTKALQEAMTRIEALEAR